MTRFAIAIPNLNQSRFLKWALESLRHQSASFSAAVVDGGSTDSFSQVVEEYQDVISSVRSGPDDGQAAAIAEGKAMADGDIVSWLNADDYYFPNTLDRVAACFEANPDVDVVYGDATHVTPEGYFLSYFPSISAFDKKGLTKGCFICQPACFVRRSAYERCGAMDPKLLYTMDWDLWCRLSSTGAKFMYLPEPLAAVRYYLGTKTLSGDKHRYLEIHRIEKKYGNRIFPMSWPGFYYYDLTFKKDKSPGEKLAFSLLGSIRVAKKLARQLSGNAKRPAVLYGFSMPDTWVKSNCTIHLPWYGKEVWKKILIDVRPKTTELSISVNEGPDQFFVPKNGRITVPVEDNLGIHRRIRLQNLNKRKFRLENFSCSFVE